MSSDKDYVVSSVGVPMVIGAINKKPLYLVTLTSEAKKPQEKFISIDRPDSQNGFIFAKGFFSDLDSEEIIKTFSDLLTKTPKELILDMWFPWHRVCSVRSLVFNANKAAR